VRASGAAGSEACRRSGRRRPRARERGQAPRSGRWRRRPAERRSGDWLITRRISLVAVCCSSDSLTCAWAWVSALARISAPLAPGARVARRPSDPTPARRRRRATAPTRRQPLSMARGAGPSAHAARRDRRCDVGGRRVAFPADRRSPRLRHAPPPGFTTYGVPVALYGDGIDILVRTDQHWSLQEELTQAAPTRLSYPSLCRPR
jgi:hypothetical protein